MGLKHKLICRLRCANSDKEGLNRLILKWCRCFKEVEKAVNCGKR